MRGGAIGDVLMTTPAIRGLRHRYPNAQILVRTKHPELFHLNPYVNQAARSIASAWFDLLIWMKYEDRLPLREHITDIFCRCAGLPPQGKDLNLFFSVGEHRAIWERLKEINGPFVTIQPWGGPWTRNKDWPEDRWERVVEAIRAMDDCVVIQLGRDEESLVPGVIDWRGRTTLREAALTIKYARLHVGCDSSGQHFAHAVGTPAVVLYGTTHPACTGYADQIGLYGAAVAAPCYHRWLCEHRLALREIRADDVIEAVRRTVTDRGSQVHLGFR